MKICRRSIFLMLVIAGANLSLFHETANGRTVKIEGNRIVDSIKVDGKLEDWYNVGSSYLDQEEASISFGNDDKNIYVLFKTREARWAQAINMTGLTIYFNKDGKKDKDFYLKFKGGASMDEIAAVSPGFKKRMSRMPAEMKQHIEERMADNDSELIIYVKDIAQRLIDQDGANGPRAAFDTSQGFFVYEFMVPLAASNGNYYGLDVAPGKKFSIGAEWGDMGDFARKPHGDFRPEGGPGGGGGMPPGSGMGGGRPSGDGDWDEGGWKEHKGDQPKMAEKQEIWIETKLLLASDEGTPK